MTLALQEPLIEDHLVLLGISWSQLEALDTVLAEVPGVRLFYLDGFLEIMTLSLEHEETNGTLRSLIEAYMREKNIRFYIRGSATLGSEETQGRKEPDESYNLETKKPNPDLVIEVILTSGGLDKLEFYKRIGVREVWFWEDGVITIYHLREEYEKVSHSLLLPDLNIDLLSRYVIYYDQYDAVTEFLQALRK
ncbi:Uma2 family endonuclease [Microcoleus sp. EPA2]|uniref:Uma2 family endonuclease n=1 Tax=Microcoleus sp. EPA2 TaxID=2841654 RepID=UPI00312B95AE